MKRTMIVTKVDKSSKYVGLFASHFVARASIQNFRIDAVSLLMKKQMISVNNTLWKKIRKHETVDRRAFKKNGLVPLKWENKSH